MACAIMADPDKMKPLDSPAISNYVQRFKNTYHPIAGFSLEIFYTLGRMGLYFRQVLEDESRYDPLLELALFEELSNWTSPHEDKELSLLGDSFRKHGLILLTRGCHHSRSVLQGDIDKRLFPWEVQQVITRWYALDIIDNLRQIPLSSWYLNIQLIPLLTAGAELTSEAVEERKEVLKRFLAIYSMNRCPPNLWAYEILKEIWAMQDTGNTKVSWLALMVERGWRWSMA
jgi:hypothetical protein